jgi:hypothetical protein
VTNLMRLLHLTQPVANAGGDLGGLLERCCRPAHDRGHQVVMRALSVGNGSAGAFDPEPA